jgi:hypothetical protein
MGTSRRDIGSSEAAAALAGAETSREWIANRVIAPGWYHPALGVCAGALIAIAETRDWPLFYISAGVYTVVTGALLWANQQRAGAWVAWYRGRSGVVFTAQIAALAVLAVCACWLDLGQGMRGTFVVAGVIAVPLLVVFGRWSDSVLCARLRSAR